MLNPIVVMAHTKWLAANWRHEVSTGVLTSVVVTLLATFCAGAWWAVKQLPLIPTLVIGGVLGALAGVAVARVAWTAAHPDVVRESSATPGDQAKEPASPAQKKPKTLRELFDTDFNYLRTSATYTLVRGERQVEIRGTVCADFKAGSRFVAYFVPKEAETFEAIAALAAHHDVVLVDTDKNVGVAGGEVGEQSVEMKDLVFSRRVYVYHEGPLTLRQAADLVDLFTSKNLVLQLRGPDYAISQFLMRPK